MVQMNNTSNVGGDTTEKKMYIKSIKKILRIEQTLMIFESYQNKFYKIDLTIKLRPKTVGVTKRYTQNFFIQAFKL